MPDVDDISIGEYIDLDLILHSDKSDRKLNEIAAILYRPIVSKKGGVIRIEPYDSKETKVRAERFMDLPISAIKSANAFFLHSAKSLQKNLLDSLNLPKMMQILHPEDQEQLQSFLQQELGGLQLTEFQEKIHSILERQHDSQSDPFSTSWLGKKLRPRKRNLNSKKQDR